MPDTRSSDTDLVPLKTVPSRLLYAERGLAGAMRLPFAAQGTATRLEIAGRHLQECSTPQNTVELLVWDAYRTVQTQTALYNEYMQQLIAEHSLTDEAANELAGKFVCPPTLVFPHCTGGAVDVTLLIQEREAPMGTEFDAFVPEAASDWYREHPPRTELEMAAAANREILRTAMEFAGFVGLSSEWWHFEWGTPRWAKVTGHPVVLDRLLPPPALKK